MVPIFHYQLQVVFFFFDIYFRSRGRAKASETVENIPSKAEGLSNSIQSIIETAWAN